MSQYYSSGRKISALRVPGGSQVDGLPPARHRKKKEQAAPHDGTLDHEKHVSQSDWFTKVLVNYNNKFKLCIEALDGDS